MIARDERNMLWGYPALYRQFEEEVLPAMQAVDEMRSKPSQVQQQSQDLSRPEGFEPPTVVIIPPTPSLRSEDEGGQAEHVQVGVSTTGLASDSNGGHVIGRVSLNENVNTLDQDPASITSTAAPVSAIADQDYVNNAPLTEKEEEASDEDNGKSWGEQGPETEKAGEAVASRARTPGTGSSPIRPEIEKEDTDADSDWVTESDSSVCLL